MHYFDPARPQINSQPAYGNPPVGVLPTIQALPARAPGQVQLRAILAQSPGTFRWFIVEVGVDQVSPILADYAQDPEATLKRVFNYNGPATPAPATPARQGAQRAAPANQHLVDAILKDLDLLAPAQAPGQAQAPGGNQ